MSAATAVPGAERDNDSRDRVVAAEEAGRAAVEAAARGDELTRPVERDALDFLLGAPQPAVHQVPVTLDTEDGPAQLKFVLRSLDGRRIDSIEEGHRNQSTGLINQLSADLEIVVAATRYLTSIGGRQVELDSEEFLTVKARRRTGEIEDVKLASPVEALEVRFKTKLGLISGVAQQVRRISGWDPSLVGKASRLMVDAAGN